MRMCAGKGSQPMEELWLVTMMGMPVSLRADLIKCRRGFFDRFSYL